tara:strand:+ start:10638 stop:10853 length:216 start_codon:yes stop_codon:yes gene_type:complete
MNATQLLQHIKDQNCISDNFVNVENENHDINIWFSRSISKWVLELDGMIIKDAKHCITLVNKLQDMNLIGA